MSGVINDPRRFFGADPLYIGKLKKNKKKHECLEDKLADKFMKGKIFNDIKQNIARQNICLGS